MVETFVNKLPVNDDPKEFIVLHSQWSSDSIKLQILHISESEESQWVGDVLKEDLKLNADTLKIPYQNFLEQCKSALWEQGGSEDFLYVLKDGKFSWQKKGLCRITYGEALLFPADNVKTTIILHSIHLTYKLKHSVDNLEKDVKNQNEIIKFYEEAINKKNAQERELLTKFCALLNSKKDKIAQLKELLIEKNSKISDMKGSNHTESHSKPSTSEFENKPNTEFSHKGVSLPKRKKVNNDDLQEHSVKETVNVTSEQSVMNVDSDDDVLHTMDVIP